MQWWFVLKLFGFYLALLLYLLCRMCAACTCTLQPNIYICTLVHLVAPAVFYGFTLLLSAPPFQIQIPTSNSSTQSSIQYSLWGNTCRLLSLYANTSLCGSRVLLNLWDYIVYSRCCGVVVEVVLLE